MHIMWLAIVVNKEMLIAEISVLENFSLDLIVVFPSILFFPQQIRWILEDWTIHKSVIEESNFFSSNNFVILSGNPFVS